MHSDVSCSAQIMVLSSSVGKNSKCFLVTDCILCNDIQSNSAQGRNPNCYGRNCFSNFGNFSVFAYVVVFWLSTLPIPMLSYVGKNNLSSISDGISFLASHKKRARFRFDDDLVRSSEAEPSVSNVSWR